MMQLYFLILSQGFPDHLCLLLFYWICKLMLLSDCEVEIFLADLWARGDEPIVKCYSALFCDWLDNGQSISSP